MQLLVPGSLLDGFFAKWGSQSRLWTPGSRVRSGFWASWAPRFQATLRSTVGGAQVPHYTLPLEGLDAAFNRTAASTDPFHAESLPRRWSAQMWIIMRREQFLGEGFWPILSEEEQQSSFGSCSWEDFGVICQKLHKWKWVSDSVYHTFLSLRNRSLYCIFINLPGYRSVSFVSLEKPFCFK